MEHATHSILNATLSKVTIYFIVTKKNGASGKKKKKKNERKKATMLFLKINLKQKHDYQCLSNICY